MFFSFRSAMSAFLAMVCLASQGEASVALLPGLAPVALPGTTVAAEADLAGVVLQDNLLPFRITGAGGALLFEGQLQNRVVRSSVTGLLHFSYRIRDTLPGLNGIVRSVSTSSFADSGRLFVDWRPDGLGAIAPFLAQRSAGSGPLVRFDFRTSGSVLVGGAESRFFYIKTMKRNFAVGGQTRIQLVTGESAVVRTLMPAN